MEKQKPIDYDFAALFYHFSNLSKYSEEEFDAMCGRIPMTEEVFEKCIKTAFDIFDFENIKYLAENFPEFAKKSALLKKDKKTCNISFGNDTSI